MRRRPSSLTSVRHNSELTLVERIRHRTAGLSGAGISLGIGDDCALLRVKPGEEIAITTDLSIAGRHFRLDWHPPETIGHRALARGLSDLAAMGARPQAAFLSLGLPRDLTVSRGCKSSWIDRFLDGFLALAAEYKTPLAGGDLAQSPLAVADIQMVGAVPRGQALLRSGARPGDLLYVTGSLGGSAAGLDYLQKLSAKNSTLPIRAGRNSDLLSPHLWPQPRISQGLWLQQKRAATAAIDISDGFSTDLNHICAESGVGAEIDAAALPISPGASLAQALHGGEDYELLFAARPGTRIPHRIGKVVVTVIGRIVPVRHDRRRLVLLTKSGRQPLERRGWEHFA